MTLTPPEVVEKYTDTIETLNAEIKHKDIVHKQLIGRYNALKSSIELANKIAPVLSNNNQHNSNGERCDRVCLLPMTWVNFFLEYFCNLLIVLLLLYIISCRCCFTG